MERSRYMDSTLPIERIENRIYIIRGQKVMLDRDLATLYEVETKVLNQSVRRNIERFPNDFMFQLTRDEDKCLRSQFVTSNIGRGGKRYLPFAFTEQGVAMRRLITEDEKPKPQIGFRED